MQSTTNSELFSLTIDPVTKQHLTVAARWAKTLAIIGMVFIVLLLLFGVVASVFLSTSMNADTSIDEQPAIFTGFGAGIASVYFIIISAVWFFPCLFLLRFASKMQVALNNNNQQFLNESFQNLKICLRFLGIVTIIVLALYALLIVFGIMYAGFFE